MFLQGSSWFVILLSINIARADAFIDALSLCVSLRSDLSSDGASFEAYCAFNVTVWGWSLG